MNLKRTAKNIFPDESGFIALISTIIIALVLLGLTFTISQAGYFARFNTLDAEYKRISLGLAESCVNSALLKIGQSFTDYNPHHEVVLIGTGSCIIDSVTFAATTTPGQKLATISTHACYPSLSSDPTKCESSSYSNINTVAIAQDPSLAHVLPTKIVPSLSAPVGATLGDFHLYLDGTQVVSGQTQIVTPGLTHTLTSSAPAGYTTTGWAGACDSSGNITPTLGSVNSCYINYTEVPTTAKLTIVANVTPAGPTAVLKIKNNSTGTEQSVTNGLPNAVPAGVSFTVTATAPVGYQASPWSGVCNPSTGVTSNLSAGQNYTCAINFTLPNTACADTVFMLDRTGSMSQTDRTNEGIAAKALLDLYSGVTPKPKVGVGSVGGLYANTAALVPDGSALQPVSGLLTNTYGIGSSGNNSQGPKLASSTGTPNNWTTPANLFQNETPTPLYTSSNTSGQQQVVNKFGFSAASLPAGATVVGLEVTSSGKASLFPAQNGNNQIPTGIGNFNSWSSSVSGNNGKIKAIESVNGDTSYINATAVNQAQTFVLPDAGLPAGTKINSVDFVVVAKAASTSTPPASIKLRLENSSAVGHQWDDVGHSLTSSYLNYTYNNAPLTINPATGTAWTLSDVNTWSSSGGLRFGAVRTNSSSASPRITAIYAVINYTPPASGSMTTNLSWNNGSNWTSSKNVSFSETETSFTMGGPSDTWGRTWSAGDLVDGKLSLRLTNNTPSGQTIYVNFVNIKLYYTVPNTGLYQTIDTMVANTSSVGTNLSADIVTGNTELNSIRHTNGLEKVLIIISDGVPTKPSGNLTNDKNAATSTANTVKTSGTKIFTIHFGDSSGTSFLNSLSSGMGYYFDAPTSEAMTNIFTTIGTKVCPAAAATLQASLGVTVYVINSYGGIAGPSDFTVNISGGGASPNSFSGGAGMTTVILNPDSNFTISETGPAGYYAPQYLGCPATVPAGQVGYCSIFNYDQPPAPPPPPPPPPQDNINIGTWIENPSGP